MHVAHHSNNWILIFIHFLDDVFFKKSFLLPTVSWWRLNNHIFCCWAWTFQLLNRCCVSSYDLKKKSGCTLFSSVDLSTSQYPHVDSFSLHSVCIDIQNLHIHLADTYNHTPISFTPLIISTERIPKIRMETFQKCIECIGHILIGDSCINWFVHPIRTILIIIFKSNKPVSMSHDGFRWFRWFRCGSFDSDYVETVVI